MVSPAPDAGFLSYSERASLNTAPVQSVDTRRGLSLIMSGAYVSQELAAEFGLLPPAFLPVGTQRLYELQRQLFPQDRQVYLTLPESFTPSRSDAQRLAALGITQLALPDDLSLGEAVIFALNLIDGGDQPAHILHGDTVVAGWALDRLDSIAIADSSEAYAWAEVEVTEGKVRRLESVQAGEPRAARRPVACGAFAFSHATALVRALTRARGRFIEGLVLYGAERPLVTAPVEAWYDFGHLQTFFRSRRLVTSARVFNTLRIDGRTVCKSSEDVAKITAEAAWLATAPPCVAIYTARMMRAGREEDRGFYETEYAYLPTLAELFVFGALGRPEWARILESCATFLKVCASHTEGDEGSGDANLSALVLGKTERRLRDFAKSTGFDVEGMLRYKRRPMPSLMQIAGDVATHIDLASGRRSAVMHGDFCFSNILYDSRVQRIRLIDPRGYVESGHPSLHGDLRYDLAKLAHSILGRYDQIIAGQYEMPPEDGNRYEITFDEAPHHAWLATMLAEQSVDGVAATGREVRAVMVSLFLSMLPLHADRPDRQSAFIANALRLYAELDSY